MGKILKKPKSLAVEIFTDANAFEVSFWGSNIDDLITAIISKFYSIIQLTFPEDATVQKKAAIMGTSVFLNAAYFEGDK